MRMKIVLTILNLLAIFAFASAEEAKDEVYTAVVTGVPGRVNTVSMKIYIKSYTPDEEVVMLANLLKTEGPDSLLKAIDKMDRGRMSPSGRVGDDVGVVRSRSTEKGRRIIMVMERPMSFAEMWRASRSTDYPFGILQMDLDQEGKGEGQLIVAAKIKFTDDNTIELESYGIQPLRLMSVRKVK